MKQFEINDTRSEIDSSEGFINDLIKKSNSNATNLYNCLNTSSTLIQDIKKKISILGDMITDLSVINGNTKTNIFLNDLDVYSVNGIEIVNDKITLNKIQEDLLEYDIKSSSIQSEKPFIIKDESERSKSVEDLLKYNTFSKIELDSIGYSLDIVLKYSTISKINQIIIELPTNTDSYPLLQNIKTLNNGTSYTDLRINNNNSYQFSLDENRQIGNIYTIDIDPVDTKELRFTLSSTTSKYLNIKGIKTTYNTYTSEGEIVLGPVVCNSPILKVGISCVESSDNVGLEISTNLVDWIQLTDSYKLSSDNVRKVVAFNTINSTSFKTDTQVTSFYIRLKLESKTLESLEYSSYRTFREDGTLSDVTSNLDKNKFSAFRIKSNDMVYGRNSFYQHLSLPSEIKDEIDLIRINGVRKIRGFNDTKYSIGEDGITYTGVDSRLKHLRLPTTININASEFDSVNSNLLDINTIPFSDEINVLHREDICIKLINKEDNYLLITKDSRKRLNININSNFTLDSTNTIFQVPDEDILLYDSIGNLLYTFKKENHYTALDENNENIYFVSTVNVLYQPPEVEKYVYNPMYPLLTLKENEYSIDEGKIVLGKGSIVFASGWKIVKTNINKSIRISYQNGNSWERIDTLYTYYHEQIDKSSIEKNVIKLDHRSIEKGSLQIYEYNAYESLGNESDVYISVMNTNRFENYFVKPEEDSNIYLEE